jgi:DNA-binding HxlR family transcriptional regulator
MARTKEYRHYCAAARTLEVIGEKWSLLIVRDLLYGPQRFTDLLGLLGGITPKWLTQRLRDLEAAGIVERGQTAGKREVWYRLTPKGQDLAPVLESLVTWGLEHGRPPEPGESVHPRRAIAATSALYNHRGLRFDRPFTVILRFSPDETHAVHFDGERWSHQLDQTEGDVTIETTPEAWAALASATPPERKRILKQIRIEGAPERVAEFQSIMSSVAG